MISGSGNAGDKKNVELNTERMIKKAGIQKKDPDFIFQFRISGGTYEHSAAVLTHTSRAGGIQRDSFHVAKP